MVSPKIAQWVGEPPPADVRRAVERLARDEDVDRVAVMPDVHLSREVCVGVALATRTTLIPAAVGGDIGCGMAAMAFDASADVVAERSNAASLLDRLYASVPIMRHRRSKELALPAELARSELSTDRLEAKKTADAQLQFGTLGRGNHFLEFQADEDGGLWLMVHTGSRGIGQAIRAAHEERGRRNRAGLKVIDADSAQGRDYLSDVHWALEYARHSRRHIVEQVCSVVGDMFGFEPLSESWISCHHNFVRAEEHEGERVWVHRKGAISARAGELGIIPGSMGAASFHVVGRGCASALCSSSHGAGRAMSRSAARQRITVQRLRDSMQGVWFDHRRAPRLLEEAPDAYKDIGGVMRAQKELTKIVRRLKPVLAFKGS